MEIARSIRTNGVEQKSRVPTSVDDAEDLFSPMDRTVALVALERVAGGQLGKHGEIAVVGEQGFDVVSRQTPLPS